MVGKQILENCPKCGYGKANLLSKEARGNTITLHLQCQKCGTKYDVFRSSGAQMAIRSMS